MNTLYIHLLGGFHISGDDNPQQSLSHAVTTPRLQSLLAWLLLHRQGPQARPHLAYVFWPDAGEAQARNNLRQSLHQLRAGLPYVDQLLRIDAQSVWWHPSIAVRLDVADFEAAVELAASEAAKPQSARRQALQRAIDAYHGDLLPSCYDEWIAEPREHLRRQAQQACRRLVQLLEDDRRYKDARQYAHRLLALDRFDETTYLCLMRLHTLNNDRAAALRLYHECAALLERELDAPPGDELQAAYARLLRSESGPATRTAAPPVALPLIGRQPQWQQLQTLWAQARRGQASLALIVGEAGIGKSRLAEEMYLWAQRQGIPAARTRAYGAEGRLAYAPIGEWLRSSSLAPAVAGLDTVWRSEISRLLPELLATDAALPAPPPMLEHWQRQRLFESLARAVLAVNAPTLLLIDDLQWCDQETLEWLHFLLRFDGGARLLLVGTARADEINENPALLSLLVALRAGERLHEFPLAPLDAAEVASLAQGIAEREIAVADALRLFAETQGNPLFVVEMMRAAEGGEAADEMQIGGPPLNLNLQSLPPKVYAVIAGRLSRLSPAARDLAAIAATIGRAFTVDVLAHSGHTDETALYDALDELWRRRIIREQGSNVYDFSHDKLRDVAYNEQGPIQQHRQHRRVALALEALYAADLDPICAQLAAHYERAGDAAKAISYYQRAGEVAQQIYANQEAANLYRRGLGLLEHLPTEAERTRAELALQSALVVPLATNAGYASNDLIDACHRSLALCHQLQQAPNTSVLRALAIGSVVRYELAEAHALGAQLLALAQHDDDALLFTEAYYVLGVTTFFQGRFSLSRLHLERAINYYAPQRSSIHITRYAQDPKVICLCRLALTLWHLGFHAEAESAACAAPALAAQLAHPFSQVYCLYWCAQYYQHCGDADKTLKYAQDCVELAREHRFVTFHSLALTLCHWASAMQGSLAEGIVQQQKALEQALISGARFQEHYYLGLLAEQFGRLGKAEHGLQLIEQALMGSNRLRSDGEDERWCDAELWRRKGELLYTGGHAADAEQALLQAIMIARRQEAKACELRAALSLALVWVAAGQQADAQTLLAPICAWFAECDRTHEWHAAGHLLDKIA